jgi:hypothetical protein
MSLKNSPVFKKDYANYQKEISLVEDESLKNELISLLLELSSTVGAVDMSHDAVVITGKMPEGIQDSRSKIAAIRKKLDSKLNHYKNTKSIKPELHSNVK